MNSAIPEIVAWEHFSLSSLSRWKLCNFYLLLISTFCVGNPLFKVWTWIWRIQNQKFSFFKIRLQIMLIAQIPLILSRHPSQSAIALGNSNKWYSVYTELINLSFLLFKPTFMCPLENIAYVCHCIIYVQQELWPPNFLWLLIPPPTGSVT